MSKRKLRSDGGWRSRESNQKGKKLKKKCEAVAKKNHRARLESVFDAKLKLIKMFYQETEESTCREKESGSTITMGATFRVPLSGRQVRGERSLIPERNTKKETIAQDRQRNFSTILDLSDGGALSVHGPERAQRRGQETYTSSRSKYSRDLSSRGKRPGESKLYKGSLIKGGRLNPFGRRNKPLVQKLYEDFLNAGMHYEKHRRDNLQIKGDLR